MPPKRRPQGTGSLSQRCEDAMGCPPVVEVVGEDGETRKVRPPHTCHGLWVGRVDFGYTPQGTRDRRTVSSKRKSEAQRKLRDLVRARASGEVARRPTLTVKGWADEWLPRHLAKVRPKTQETDRSAVRKWIVPTIGHRRIIDLTPADARAVTDAIRGAGLSSTTAGTYHRILIKMLRDAIREGYSVPQSIMASEQPKKAVNDRTDIPIDQARAILAQIVKRTDGPRWMLSMLTGMRQAEILGLLVDRFNPDTGELVIEWQLQHPGSDPVFPDGLRVRHLTGGYWLTEPKTAQGRRSIRLGPLLRLVMVKAVQEWQPNPWGLFWVDAKGLPIRDYKDRAEWKAIQAAAKVAHPSGRPWHLHECRHAFITMLKRANVDDSVIAQLVGQAKVLPNYVHLGTEDSAPAVGGVESLLLQGELVEEG